MGLYPTGSSLVVLGVVELFDLPLLIVYYMNFEKVMTAESALRWCSSASGWDEFSSRALSAGEKVDLFLSQATLKHIDEASDLIDWRY